MKRILFSEFVKRLSRESPEAVFTWYSIAETKKHDVVVAEVKLEGDRLLFTNRKAHNHYGRDRLITDLPFPHEWVDAIYFSRSLRSSNQLTVRTYI